MNSGKREAKVWLAPGAHLISALDSILPGAHTEGQKWLAQLESAHFEMNAKRADEVLQLKGAKAELEASLVSVKGDLNVVHRRLTASQAESVALQKEILSNRANFEEELRELRLKASECMKVEEKLTATEYQLSSIVGELKAAKAQLEARESEISEIEGRIAELQKECCNANQLITTLTMECDRLKHAHETFPQIESDIIALTNANREAEAKIETLESSHSNLERRLGLETKKVALAEKRLREANGALAEAKDSIVNKNSELKALRSQVQCQAENDKAVSQLKATVALKEREFQLLREQGEPEIERLRDANKALTHQRNQTSKLNAVFDSHLFEILKLLSIGRREEICCSMASKVAEAGHTDVSAKLLKEVKSVESRDRALIKITSLLLSRQDKLNAQSLAHLIKDQKAREDLLRLCR